jgi:hypothetical protein
LTLRRPLINDPGYLDDRHHDQGMDRNITDTGDGAHEILPQHTGTSGASLFCPANYRRPDLAGR